MNEAIAPSDVDDSGDVLARWMVLFAVTACATTPRPLAHGRFDCSPPSRTAAFMGVAGLGLAGVTAYNVANPPTRNAEGPPDFGPLIGEVITGALSGFFLIGTANNLLVARDCRETNAEHPLPPPPDPPDPRP